jgi:hypothetical protein
MGSGATAGILARAGFLPLSPPLLLLLPLAGCWCSL